MSAPFQFGVALSGGGFRATLFHLGVIRFLFEAGLLREVRFISGVSGGAILAAHIGLHWREYCGDTDTFTEAAAEIVSFARRDLRNRVLRRWLFGWLTLAPRLLVKWSRTELLQREYRHLYGDRRVKQFTHVGHPGEPRIVIQSASLTTGMPCTFGHSGFMEYKEEADGRALHLPRDRELSFDANPEVALAVAASSAFPPLFPPVHLDQAVLAADPPLEQPHELTDGGVFDNFGIERPLWYYQNQEQTPNERLEAFLLSDGEGSFSRDDRSWRFKFALTRNVRATELMMKRLTRSTWNHLSEQRTHTFAGVSIAHSPDAGGSNLQTALKNIRTDLDRFSDLEIESLVEHGYSIARAQLIANKWVPPDAPTGSWCPVRRSTLDNQQKWCELKSASARRWWPLVTDVTDAYLLWLLLALAAWVEVLRRLLT